MLRLRVLCLHLVNGIRAFMHANHVCTACLTTTLVNPASCATALHRSIAFWLDPRPTVAPHHQLLRSLYRDSVSVLHIRCPIYRTTSPKRRAACESLSVRPMIFIVPCNWVSSFVFFSRSLEGTPSGVEVRQTGGTVRFPPLSRVEGRTQVSPNLVRTCYLCTTQPLSHVHQLYLLFTSPPNRTSK